MSLARVYSRALVGMDAPLVTVETHISNGMPGFNIVGLPETAVRESRERVRSAIINANLEFPARRVTVNLAPAELPKVGGRYDLAIALSILAASDQLQLNLAENREDRDFSELSKGMENHRTTGAKEWNEKETRVRNKLPCEGLAQKKTLAELLESYEFLGELSLGGELRGVSGVLPAAMRARDSGRRLIVPAANRGEAGLVSGCVSFFTDGLQPLLMRLAEGANLPSCPHTLPAKGSSTGGSKSTSDLANIRGQMLAKRALQIAAAGGHNLLLKGPPGTGKTLLASALAGILPRLDEEAALEVAAIRSIANLKIELTDFFQPPLRAPHHTATPVSLVGGGTRALPGEVSLAHHGVLFLDELPEFTGKALEALREPLESRTISISRANQRMRYPASFQLVAAMNPCPCGYLGDPSGRCRCTQPRIDGYRQKLSGPLLDRIDLTVPVPRLSHRELSESVDQAEDSTTVRRRVASCRQLQLARSGKLNSFLNATELDRFCKPDKAGNRVLRQAMQNVHLSARGVHRVLRLARTLADLQEREAIREGDLLEALAFRT